MAYLKQEHNTRLLFNLTYPDVNMNDFQQYDWTEFYGDVKEAVPTIDLHMMVDRNHA